MSIKIIKLADLKDPNDSQGRTWRQINAAMSHQIPIGSLVEIKNGARLFVVNHTRDCDQTPLYSLGIDMKNQNDYIATLKLHNGYSEDSLTVIKFPSVENDNE